jgi:hypothetical protein
VKTNPPNRGISNAASRWLIVAVPALCVVAGCCGPDLEEVIKQHKPAIEAKLTTLPSIRDQVSQLPRIDADRVTHTGAPLVLALANVESAKANASLCYAEDLQNAEELGFVWGRIPHTGGLNECASVARRGHEVFNPANPDGLLSHPFGFSAESMFERCEAVTTLLVIRTVEFVQPGAPEPAGSAFVPDPSICEPAASGGSDAGAPEAGGSKEVRLRFGGGRIRAEVLVFALEGARYEGGFRVEASSSPKVKGSDVQADLANKVRAAIAAGVKEHVPGATVRL